MSDAKIVRTLEPINFHGQSLVVVNRDDEPYVVMKPIVEGMRLDWRSQRAKFTEDVNRWGGVMIPLPSQGGEQTTLCLPLRKLGAWLMTLQTSRMDAGVAERVLGQGVGLFGRALLPAGAGQGAGAAGPCDAGPAPVTGAHHAADPAVGPGPVYGRRG